MFVGKYEPGQKLKDAVVDGDSVTLKIGEESVQVRKLITLSLRQYRGTIYGFEPSFGIEYHGLSIGQEVDFSEKHIFACSTA